MADIPIKPVGVSRKRPSGTSIPSCWRARPGKAS